MNPPSAPFTAKERLESLKAAAVSGAAAVAVALAFAGVHHFLQNPNPTSTLAEAVHLTVSLVSGALFGIVYRYTVRRDKNPQLGAGATAAFGLLRGLAQVEVALSQPLGQLALMMGESMLLFAFVSGLLQAAMQRGWVQPFGDIAS